VNIPGVFDVWMLMAYSDIESRWICKRAGNPSRVLAVSHAVFGCHVTPTFKSVPRNIPEFGLYKYIPSRP
jgi:hypothetical protein